MLGAKLKKAPNTKVGGLTAHLQQTKNPRTVTAGMFEQRYKEASSALQEMSKVKPLFEGDTTGDVAGVVHAWGNIEAEHGEKVSCEIDDSHLSPRTLADALGAL